MNSIHSLHIEHHLPETVKNDFSLWDGGIDGDGGACTKEVSLLKLCAWPVDLLQTPAPS